MKQRLPLFLLLLFSLFAFSQEDGFVENKGQWDNRILYKKSLNDGALFLEKNKLTYNFVPMDDVNLSEAHHQGKRKIIDTVHYHSFYIEFKNQTNENLSIEAACVASDYVNYFIGNDQSKWASHVHYYGDITYKNLYDGIDMQLFSEGNSLETEFKIAPKSNPNNIEMVYHGGVKLSLDIYGNLHIKTSVNEMIEKAPIAYQEVDGKKNLVDIFWVLQDSVVQFKLGKYDKRKPLILDPHLVFATYSGSSGDNWGFTATYDHDGNVYSGGIVFETGYPTNTGAYQETFQGGVGINNYQIYSHGCDVGIIKYNSTGVHRLYATYLGGRTGEELPHSLVVDKDNNLLIFGTTGSWDFPMTHNAWDPSFNGGSALTYDNVVLFPQGIDIYVAKLSEDGSNLLASTYVGGTGNDGLNFRDYYANGNIIMVGNDSLYYNYADGARGELVTDDDGNVYVGTTSFSSDFPTTATSFDPTFNGKQEGVVFKLNSNLNYLIWSSYLGGNNDDAIYSITFDKDQDVYVAGGSVSHNMPTTQGVVEPYFNGGTTDGFVAHISKNGQTLKALTYIGSPAYDQCYFVRTDKQKDVFVVGQTKASGYTFIKNAAYNKPNSGQFIVHLNNDLNNIIWSTAFGTGSGKPNISISAFEVDICRRIFVSGWGREWAGNWNTIQGTKGMDITANATQTQTDGQDFYVMALESDASALDYATFFGELHYSDCYYSGHDHVDGGTSRLDSKGNIYQAICASCGGCDGIPTYPDSVWSKHNGAAPSHNCNNAVFRLNIFENYAYADFKVPTPVCAPAEVHIANKSTGKYFYWDFGDGTTSTEKNPSAHTYPQVGTYTITLIVTDSSSCNISDTVKKTIQVMGGIGNDTLSPVTMCQGESVQIGLNNGSSTASYWWTPNHHISDNTEMAPYVYPDTSMYYTLIVDNGVCVDTLSQYVEVFGAESQIGTQDSVLCHTGTIRLFAKNADSNYQYVWTSSLSFSDTLNDNIHDTDINVYLHVGETSKYYLLSINDHGCKAVDSILVIADSTTIAIKDTSLTTCYGICDGKVNFISEGFLPFTYHWNNGYDSSQASSLCAGNYTVEMTDALGCRDTIDFTILQPDSVIIDLVNQTKTGCGDSAATGTATVLASGGGGTPYTYQWSNGDTSATADSLYARKYIVTVTDGRGCSMQKPVFIKDTSQLHITVSVYPIACYGNTTGKISIDTVEKGKEPYACTWSTGDTTFMIDSLSAGDYSLTLIDANQCYRFVDTSIQQQPPIHFEILKHPILCYGEKALVKIRNIIGGTPPYVYYWSDNTDDTDFAYYPEGSHMVVVADAHNCYDTIEFSLIQPQKLTLNSDVVNQLCSSSCNGHIYLSVLGGTKPYKYEWNTGEIAPYKEAVCEGTYSVTVTDANRCQEERFFDVYNEQYIPPIDIEVANNHIFKGQSVVLNAIPSSYETYSWMPHNTLHLYHTAAPVATPDKDTITYNLSIIDSNGCRNQDTVTIYLDDFSCGDPYIYVPNAFTPNGDGKNDILYVYGGVIDYFYFAIFDRWGELVFETTNINQGWDGTYNGKLLDPAVFVYHLEATCINKQKYVKNGNITLIR